MESRPSLWRGGHDKVISGAYPVKGVLVAAVAEGVFSKFLDRHDERFSSATAKFPSQS